MGCHRSSGRAKPALWPSWRLSSRRCVDHRDTLRQASGRPLLVLAPSSTGAGRASFKFGTQRHLRDGATLEGMLETKTADTISLASGVDITIRPASFRTIRGITAVAAIADEIAFLAQRRLGAIPILRSSALRPALATTGGLLAAISSPHAKRGELYDTFKRHFGPTGASVDSRGQERRAGR